MTPVPRAKPLAAVAPKQGADGSPSLLKNAVAVWLEGFGVMGRLMWFCLHFGLMLLPWQVVAVVITGKSEAVVFDNGKFDPRAAIACVLLLVYLPLACHWAARASGYLGRQRRQGKGLV